METKYSFNLPLLIKGYFREIDKYIMEGNNNSTNVMAGLGEFDL